MLYLISAIIFWVILYKIQKWEYKDETPEERAKRIDKLIRFGQ